MTAFFDLHQRAASCVTTGVLSGQAYHPVPEPLTMGFKDGVTRLGRRSILSLTVRHGYRFVEPTSEQPFWQVTTTGYSYRLYGPTGGVVLSYQWHPVGQSPITFPHLHVGCQVPPVDLSKAHLPTGFVSLPAVIRLAIAELGVAPLRADWAAVLDRAERELGA